MPSSGPVSVFGVRSLFMRARFSQTPAPASSDAASITDTLPIPARRNANANAAPVCPPPTITTLWSIPSRSGTQLSGSGPNRRSASSALASGLEMVVIARVQSGNGGMIEILKRDARAGNQAIQLYLDAFYRTAG